MNARVGPSWPSTAAMVAALPLCATAGLPAPARAEPRVPTVALHCASAAPFSAAQLQRALEIRTPLELKDASTDSPADQLLVDATGRIVVVTLSGPGRDPHWVRYVWVGPARGDAAARLVVLALSELWDQLPSVGARPVAETSTATDSRPDRPPPSRSIPLTIRSGLAMLVQDGAPVPALPVAVEWGISTRIGLQGGTTLAWPQTIGSTRQTFVLRRLPFWLQVGGHLPLTTDWSVCAGGRLGSDVISAHPDSLLGGGSAPVLLPFGGGELALTRHLSPALDLALSAGWVVLFRRVEFQQNGQPLLRSGRTRGHIALIAEVQPW